MIMNQRCRVLFFAVFALSMAAFAEETFYKLNTPFAAEWIKNVYVDSSGVLYVTESKTLRTSDGFVDERVRPDTINRIFYSADRGNTWQPIPTPYMDKSMNDGSWGGPIVNSRGMVFDIDFDTAFSLSVFRSVNKGQSWEKVLPNLGIDGASFFKVNSLDYVVFKSSYHSLLGYYYSKDDAASWARFDSAGAYDFDGNRWGSYETDFAISQSNTFLFSSYTPQTCTYEYMGICLEYGGSLLEKHMLRNDSIFTFNANLQCFTTGKAHTVFLGVTTGGLVSRNDGRTWAVGASGSIKDIVLGQGNMILIKKDGAGVFKKAFDAPDDTTGWIYCGLRDSTFWSLCGDRQDNLYFVTKAGLFSTKQPVSILSGAVARNVYPGFSFGKRAMVFENASSARVTVDLYSLSGKKSPLVNNRMMTPGKTVIPLPSNLAPGLYVVRCRIDGRSFLRRFSVL